MFRPYMALEEKDPPLVTVTQTAPADRAATAVRPSTDEVDQLKERDSSRYQFIGEHGRGGLGRVMRTRDKDLRREVAIKEILRPGGMAEARFIREAMITARLEHPGIVPVHDAGRWPDGTPFYAMKLVEGRSLKAVIAEKGTLRERLSLLSHVLAVAETIAYAHSQRVIHRDLKPSNVLVGGYGETVVIDWGLAKDLEEPSSALETEAGPYRSHPNDDLTVNGQVLGTPAYMPPEQALGADVDERADIYAVGAILYHILAGRPPFKGSTSAEVLAAVTAGPPEPIHTYEPEVPHDLAAIAAKAMSRQRNQRYASAMTMVEDLRRFQSGQFVMAYSYSPAAVVRKWASRHRIVLGVVATSVIALFVVGAIGVERTVAQKHVAETRLEHSLLLQAAATLDTDPTSSIALLKSLPFSSQTSVERVSIALAAAARGVARHVLVAGNDGVSRLLIFEQLDRVISASTRLRSWTISSGRMTAELDAGKPIANVVPFPSGAPIVAYVDAAGGAGLWDFQSGRKRIVHQQTDGAIGYPLAISHTGAWLAFAGSTGKEVVLVELNVNNPFSAYDGPLRDVTVQTPNVVSQLKFSDETLWIASEQGDMAYFQPDNMDRVATLIGSGPSYDIVISDNQQRIASAGRSGLVRIWDTHSAQLVTERIFDAYSLLDVAFCDIAGESIAVAANDGKVWSWELGPVNPRNIARHGRPVEEVSCPLGTGRVLSIGADGVVISSSRFGGEDTRFLGHADGLSAVAVSRDGQYLASGSRDGSVRVWSMANAGSSFRLTERQPRHLFPVTSGVLASYWDGSVESWSWRGEYKYSAPPAGAKIVKSIALSVSPVSIAQVDEDGSLRIVEDTGTNFHVHTSPATLSSAVHDIVMRRSDSTVFIAFDDGSISEWRLHADKAPQIAGLGKPIEQIWVAQTANTLYVLLRDTSLVRLDEDALGAWKVTNLVSEPGYASAVALADAAQAIVVGSSDGELVLWGSRSMPLRHRAHSNRVLALAISPNGQYVASSGLDKMLVVQDMLRNVEIARRHIAVDIEQLSYSPDGKFLLMRDVDGGVSLSPVSQPLLAFRLSNVGQDGDVIDLSEDSTEVYVIADKGRLARRIVVPTLANMSSCDINKWLGQLSTYEGVIGNGE